jgi:hypothetical protein
VARFLPLLPRDGRTQRKFKRHGGGNSTRLRRGMEWNRTGERAQSAGTRECAHTFGNIGANAEAGVVVLPLASLARDADPKACMCSLARISLPGVVKLRAKRVTVGVGASGFVRPGSSVVSATPLAFPDLSAISFGV